MGIAIFIFIYVVAGICSAFSLSSNPKIDEALRDLNVSGHIIIFVIFVVLGPIMYVRGAIGYLLGERE